MNITLIFNEPEVDRYQAMGESKAELGVIAEVKAVCQALIEMDHQLTLVSLRPPMEDVRRKLAGIKADVVFNLFEGFDGRPETEPEVARLLFELNLSFSGCPASSLELALDKEKAKTLLSQAGLPTPAYQILSPQTISDFKLEFPCIVKPVADDASHGITEESVVNDGDSLARQVKKVSHLFGGKALVEEYIDGREFNTTVIGNRELTVLGISEIVYTLPPEKPRILTFSAKWDEESAYYLNSKAVCPADINLKESQQIAELARSAARLLGCRGYARVDFRQDRQGNIKILEVNPNPDITPGAGAALQAAACGLTYRQFIDRIVQSALEKD
jgi:D-alanine-D-alanine ligase